MSEHFRTQYEKCYEDDEYYWGIEPASFLDELIKVTNKKASELSVLDIGCGEGKDAVYMAQQGCDVTAFDITEVGFRIEKMIEPLPTEEILAEHPDQSDLFHKPDFLLVKVKK